MLLKRHIQSKQIFNYVCRTVIYVAGVPPETKEQESLSFGQEEM